MLGKCPMSDFNFMHWQCVGIPMGTDCAPLLANLFLFFYEYRYMNNLIKNYIFMARRFNTMRYIDDLLILTKLMTPYRT